MIAAIALVLLTLEVAFITCRDFRSLLRRGCGKRDR